jgi:hypothetical protein
MRQTRPKNGPDAIDRHRRKMSQGVVRDGAATHGREAHPARLKWVRVARRFHFPSLCSCRTTAAIRTTSRHPLDLSPCVQIGMSDRKPKPDKRKNKDFYLKSVKKAGLHTQHRLPSPSRRRRLTPERWPLGSKVLWCPVRSLCQASA